MYCVRLPYSSLAIYSRWFTEFLGANNMDEDPFLVTPYVPKGNLSQYIKMYPNCNKTKIVSSPPFSITNIQHIFCSCTKSCWG